MRTQPSVRIGFTLVELLVVITIIGMLMALLIPAVGAARARATAATCMNSLKQIGTGLIDYQLAKEKFPGYVQPLKRSNGEYLQIDTTNGISGSVMTHTNSAGAVDSLISWAGVILPQIEGQAIYDNMVDATAAGDRAKIRPIELLICPADSDLKALPDNAGMSYSVNTGAWDYDASGNFLSPGDTKANGLCHNLTLGNVTTKMGTKGDGASNTILLAENVHKEIEPGSTLGTYCWAGVDVNNLNGSLAEQQFGIVWVLSPTPVSESSGTTLFQYQMSTEGTNPGYTAILPEYARPASNHPSGSINTVFADSHAKAVAPTIDYTVYQRLMTPYGRKCVDPADHTEPPATGGAIELFRNLAPLAESDY